MHARVNIIFGKKDQVWRGVAHLEESDRAVVEATAGNSGLTTMMDREAGVIVAVSYWDESGQSLEAALTQARETAATAAGGDLLVETYEVVARDRLADPTPGATVRMDRLQIDTTDPGGPLEFLREQVLPQLRNEPELCSVELLIDPGVGRGLLLTAWTDEEAASRGGSVLDRLGNEAAERSGVTFPRTEDYTLVGASVSG
jgi:hypothetical protein